jgi:hypothetical protein
LSLTVVRPPLGGVQLELHVGLAAITNPRFLVDREVGTLIGVSETEGALPAERDDGHGDQAGASCQGTVTSPWWQQVLDQYRHFQ